MKEQQPSHSTENIHSNSPENRSSIEMNNINESGQGMKSPVAKQANEGIDLSPIQPNKGIYKGDFLKVDDCQVIKE